MLGVVEYDLKNRSGVDSWELAREYTRAIRRNYPERNCRLLNSPTLGSNKLWGVLEARSLADWEQWWKLWGQDEEYKKLEALRRQKEKESGGRALWTWRLHIFNEVPIE